LFNLPDFFDDMFPGTQSGSRSFSLHRISNGIANTGRFTHSVPAHGAALVSLFLDGPASISVNIRSIAFVDLVELVVDASDSRGPEAFGAEVAENAFMMASRRAAAALSSSGVFGFPILRTGAADGLAFEVATLVERLF
jgi:hypothetical protein